MCTVGHECEGQQNQVLVHDPKTSPQLSLWNLLPLTLLVLSVKIAQSSTCYCENFAFCRNLDVTLPYSDLAILGAINHGTLENGVHCG